MLAPPDPPKPWLIDVSKPRYGFFKFVFKIPFTHFYIIKTRYGEYKLAYYKSILHSYIMAVKENKLYQFNMEDD